MGRYRTKMHQNYKGNQKPTGKYKRQRRKKLAKENENNELKKVYINFLTVI